MTIKHLKEMIKDLPDDMRVYDSRDLESPEEFVSCFVCDNGRKTFFTFETRDDFDVETELEAMFDHFVDNDIDELDGAMLLVDMGYTAEDFDYNKDRRLWFETFTKEHGLI